MVRDKQRRDIIESSHPSSVGLQINPHLGGLDTETQGQGGHTQGQLRASASPVPKQYGMSHSRTEAGPPATEGQTDSR